MAYLITGGTGFLGSNIARQLLQAGRKVVLCDISLDGDVVSMLKSRAAPGQLRIVQADVSKKGTVNRLMEGHEIETVIHMASLLTEDCSRDSSRAIEVNCLGTVYVMESAVRHGVSKLVWGSSIAAGEHRSAGEVEQLPSWALIYIATMTFNEDLARVYRDKFDLQAVGLRFPYVYGVGRVRGASFGQKLITRAIAGKPVRVPFGDEIMNWLYIEDAVRAVMCAIRSDRIRKVSYTVSGNIRSMREVAGYLEQTCHSSITLESGGTGLNWRYVDSEIKGDLGYEPEYSIEEGIAAMREEMRKNPSLSATRLRPAMSRPAAPARMHTGRNLRISAGD